MADRESSIVVSGVGKSFHRENQAFEALRDVDLTISPHEFVCLVGPSGCGKTTLLNMIAGLITPTTGHVTIGDQEVTGPGSDRAYVFQDHALFPWMTVADNVAFSLESRGESREEAREVAGELLHSLGLEQFAQAYPRTLSGGMKQRVNLARALAVNPDIILMDEPFAALDAQTRYVLLQQLLAIWSTLRKTVVFVTHNIDEAMTLADRVIMMKARPGRIKEIIPVPLERPRDEADMEYVRLRKYIFDSMLAEMNTGNTLATGELAAIIGRRKGAGA